jgi:hypothetical protein
VAHLVGYFALMNYLHLSVLAAMVTACGDPPKTETQSGDAADEVRIVYQGRLDGEFEPCG